MLPLIELRERGYLVFESFLGADELAAAQEALSSVQDLAAQRSKRLRRVLAGAGAPMLAIARRTVVS